MTNKEAIRRIIDHMTVHKIGEPPHIKIAEALNMAVAALEQQDRRGKWNEVHEHMWKKREDGEIDEFAWESEFHNGPICELCGETPCIYCKPNWKSTECYEKSYRCSECNYHSKEKQKFCPECGIKMEV